MNRKAFLTIAGAMGPMDKPEPSNRGFLVTPGETYHIDFLVFGPGAGKRGDDPLDSRGFEVSLEMFQEYLEEMATELQDHDTCEDRLRYGSAQACPACAMLRPGRYGRCRGRDEDP